MAIISRYRPILRKLGQAADFKHWKPYLAARRRLRYPSKVTRPLSQALKLALSEYAERLRCCFGDRLLELRLFGSYARGEAHEDSDVDVLVVVEGLTDLEIGTVAGEVAPIIQKTGLPLAPLPMSNERLAILRSQNTALIAALDREGISL